MLTIIGHIAKKELRQMSAATSAYLVGYNTKRPHQGRGMNGRTPQTAFSEGLPKPPSDKKEKSPPAKPSKQLAA